MKRKPFNKKTRIKVYDKFFRNYIGRCAYCGCEIEYKDMQVDHVIPVYRHSEKHLAKSQQSLYKE